MVADRAFKQQVRAYSQASGLSYAAARQSFQL